jgi:hypothetical protein
VPTEGSRLEAVNSEPLSSRPDAGKDLRTPSIYRGVAGRVPVN